MLPISFLLARHLLFLFAQGMTLALVQTVLINLQNKSAPRVNNKVLRGPKVLCASAHA